MHYAAITTRLFPAINPFGEPEKHNFFRNLLIVLCHHLETALQGQIAEHLLEWQVC